MPDPVLKPLKRVINIADIDSELEELLKNMTHYNGYFIVKSTTNSSLLGPSMVNDKCPIASALKVRVNGTLVKSAQEAKDIAFGNALHKAYPIALKEWNPGWIIQTNVKYNRIIEYNGVELNIGFEPDVLMSPDNNEWHLIELKSSRIQPTHEVQLALYWYLLKPFLNISGVWLVTIDAVLKYNPADLVGLVELGLGYLANVRRVLDSWSGESPGFIVKGKCPCKWAPLCPIYREYYSILKYT